MLLSPVSVLVVAQSSSEIPEGLMNNPVLKVNLPENDVVPNGEATDISKDRSVFVLSLIHSKMISHKHSLFASKKRNFVFRADPTHVSSEICSVVTDANQLSFVTDFDQISTATQLRARPTFYKSMRDFIPSETLLPDLKVKPKYGS